MAARSGSATARPGFVRRHRALLALALLLGILVGAVAGFAFYLNAQLVGIGRFDLGLDAAVRAPELTGRAAQAQNILLLGADNGANGHSVADELADGQWSPGVFRSDTMMIAHVSADRRRVTLVSIPRDSYVVVPGHGRQKVNAGFSFGGPRLAVRTVEDLTGLYIDHVAVLDWDGFKAITRAVGGVPVTLSEKYTDPRNGATLPAGTYSLEGEQALAYVRARYGLAEGDFDRIKRQQNFLRSALRKSTRMGVLANPVALTNLVQGVAGSLAVDEDFSTGKMRSLALSLRGLRADDIVYLTAPMRGFDDVAGVGSVVLLDRAENAALWRSLRQDRVNRYLDAYGGETLPATDEVR